jgi:hypothetical protein
MARSGWKILLLILWITKSQYIIVLNDGLASVTAIAFMLIQWRVTLGLTTGYDGSTKLVSGPIQFRSAESTSASYSTPVQLRRGAGDDSLEMDFPKPASVLATV